MIRNPILPGFYPDPSICRVEDDFYLVTSSFSYFPGVPIFKSTDLVNWQQIGHVLDRPSQLPLNGNAISGGIFAPTIRHHAGVFYMITTNIVHGGNFIVTATDPAGPWSEPHWLEGAEGIDPSLFWDDDDKAYYSGTRGFGAPAPMIWVSEIDLDNFCLVGEKHEVWGGALVGCHAPEAPHLYKRDGWYYLMIAEGGTEYYHAVTIARSRSVFGPYEGYQGNPILTHRHLGSAYPICNVGHGDLVELRDGNWYMVALASRPYGGYHKNMGRETFIAPVIWEDGWPVVSPGTGCIEWTYQAPNLTEMSIRKTPVRDDFNELVLDMQWNVLGTPRDDLYRLEESRLELRAVEQSLFPSGEIEMYAHFRDRSIVSKPFIGRRQQHFSYTVETAVTFNPQNEQEHAGLAILQNAFHALFVEKVRRGNQNLLRVVKHYLTLEGTLTHNRGCGKYQQEIVSQITWPANSVILRLVADEQKHSFYAIDPDGEVHIIAQDVDGSFLGTETAGGFVGAYIGMFASGNGTDTGNAAAFDWFSYEGK